jgi:hypothetical protein
MNWDKILSNLQQNGRGHGAPLQRLARASLMAELREHRQKLLTSPRNTDERRLLKFGYRVYSQSDEDGILHEIFRRVGEGNRTFLEIGTGDGLENNTLFLLVQGWRGSWVEASARRVTAARRKLAPLIETERLRVEQHVVTVADVDETIRSLAPSPQIDLLSVDIDGNDYHILRAIRSVVPRVIVVEYNAKFPPDVPWVMEYDKAHRWDGSDYFGSSLRALEILLSERGYCLVACNLLGCNAFFVRNDLVSDPPFCSPFTAENHYEPARYFLLPAYDLGFPAGFGPFQMLDLQKSPSLPV